MDEITLEYGQLCLGRREGESIMIGDHIEVKVAKRQNGRVRIVVRAPKNVPIHRREVWEAIKQGGEQC